MKNHNYLASFADTAKRNMTSARLAGTTALMVIVPTVSAFASETPTPGQNYLSGEVWTSIQAGFSNLAASCTEVLAISCVTACGIVGMTTAAKYAIKKIKGALNQAS